MGTGRAPPARTHHWLVWRSSPSRGCGWAGTEGGSTNGPTAWPTDGRRLASRQGPWPAPRPRAGQSPVSMGLCYRAWARCPHCFPRAAGHGRGRCGDRISGVGGGGGARVRGRSREIMRRAPGTAAARRQGRRGRRGSLPASAPAPGEFVPSIASPAATAPGIGFHSRGNTEPSTSPPDLTRWKPCRRCTALGLTWQRGTRCFVALSPTRQSCGRDARRRGAARQHYPALRGHLRVRARRRLPHQRDQARPDPSQRRPSPPRALRRMAADGSPGGGRLGQDGFTALDFAEQTEQGAVADALRKAIGLTMGGEAAAAPSAPLRHSLTAGCPGRLQTRRWRPCASGWTR